MDEVATKSDDGGTSESQPLLGDNKRTTDDIATSTCRLPIEPIPAFFLLAIGLQNPILKEFLYYKQCEKNNITFVWDKNSSKCFLNMSDPGYMAQQTAQALASQQLLYHNIALYIPIGILLAAMYLGGHMMSAVGIRLFGSVMDDLWIAQIGVLSDVLANTLMAVSAYLPHRDMVPFIVPCVRMFGRMQHSVISSGMSKLVPQDRQGTVFALLYCFEAINKLTQSLVFLPVYRATLHWFPGFGFLINPAINFAITAPVLGFVHYRTRCRSTESKLTVN
ncbi:SLC46A3 [Branchiostoma lanceolatum]|uniref:SLC46A3 protein n=1 Tax=Branchiostoma lanceolatum TaxID=7740 RepID=A0A8K0EIW8_BRALA|nr:SLC46A3 [Branchiostoma lanceolatum]